MFKLKADKLKTETKIIHGQKVKVKVYGMPYLVKEDRIVLDRQMPKAPRLVL